MGTISRQQRVKWFLMTNYEDPIESDSRWSAEQSFIISLKEFNKLYWQQYHEKWLPTSFDWNSHHIIDLIRNYSRFFPVWWDPNYFVWRLKSDNPSWHLSLSCADWFEVWFDAEKYDYKLCSECLTGIYYDKFTTWWYPDRFKFTNDTANGLEDNCQQFKEIWAPYYVEWKLLNE